MIQPPGLYVFFDLGIPRVGLHFREPLRQFTLFAMRKLFDLGSDLCYGAHRERLHRGKDLVTSPAVRECEKSDLQTPILISAF